jgi:hypothetical protein
VVERIAVNILHEWCNIGDRMILGTNQTQSAASVKFQADIKIRSWRSARRGLNHREDGSEIVLSIFACTTRMPQATVVAIIGVIIDARPRLRGRCWLIVGDS